MREGRLERRQDLPAEAFVSAAELRRLISALGNDWGLLLVAISYRWLTAEHPDPDGFHLQAVAQEVIAANDEQFLLELKDKWDKHKLSSIMIRDILMYMDRTYVVAQKKVPVYERGLLIFRDEVCRCPRIKDRLLGMLLELIGRERTGEMIPRGLIKTATGMLNDLNREVYIRDFETPFLTATALFYQAEQSWINFAQDQRGKWNAYVKDNTSNGHNKPNSYAQAIGVVNTHCDKRDRIIAAAGGLPAEVTANWCTLEQGTVDVEFGFSCMGYEIAGAWGARIAQSELEPDNDIISFCGDGSYLMLNSDIYSSVLSEKKIIVLVLDNGGFAVINKLQNNTGNESFNNLFVDCPTIPAPFAVDFAAHARSMGAEAEKVANPTALKEAFHRAKASRKSYVIVMDVDAYDGWTNEGHTWWEVGTPEISDSQTVTSAHQATEAERVKQRRGI